MVASLPSAASPRAIALAALVALLAAAGRSAGAQAPATTPAPQAAPVLAGTVRDAASGLLVPGAVVVLLDDADRTLARALSDERGRWRAPRAAGATRLRVLRIGFRPREARLADAGSSLDLAIERIPALLTPVRVRDQPRCGRSPDRASALALLEQVRAGLLATLVGAAAPPDGLTRLGFERRLAQGREGEEIVRQAVRRVDTTGTSPTAFRPVRDGAGFVRDGFLQVDRDGSLFLAPDAGTLTDDAFAAGYCFRLVDGDAARAGQVGLGFRPVRERRGRVDVDGVLWVDTVGRALRDLEFRYLGLDPALAPVAPGGRLGFDTLPNGATLVTRWSLRLPSAESVRGAPRNRPFEPPLAPAPAEVGGELAAATWADGRRWVAPLGALRLQLTRAGRPAAGVLVRLPNTSYAAASDATGVAVVAGLLPGPYDVELFDPALAPLGLALPVRHRFAAVRESTHVARVAVPTAAQVVDRRCGVGGTDLARAASGDTARLLARVEDAAGRPVGDARWTLLVAPPAADSGQPAAHVAVATGTTGSDGLLAWCGLPTGRWLALQVTAGRRRADAAVRSDGALATTVVRVP